jgi:hypothetical protein
VLELNSKPMAVITETVQPCFIEPVLTICEPCRQINTYLPRIKNPTNKENSAIEVLARSFLQLDDEFMDAVCGFCFSPDTDDCECLIRYGKSIGVGLTYTTIDSTNCMKFGYEQVVDICCKPVNAPLVIPVGFAAWKIPDAEYATLGCSVGDLQILSYSDDHTGISIGIGTQQWLSSQSFLDDFLQVDEQNYPSPIQGDLLIGSHGDKPILFVKDGSIIDKSTFYFLLQCSGSPVPTFKTFTEPYIPAAESGAVICKKKIFAYCQQLCQICEVHKLDPCNNPEDFEFFRKIVKFKARWFNSSPTRKNIVDSLIDWFGSEAYVVDAHYPNIYWSLGRPPTEDELSIMPFVYSMMPIQDGIDLIFTQEL